MLSLSSTMRPSALRTISRSMATAAAPARTGTPPHLLTLADLSPAQITHLIQSAMTFKHLCKTVSPSRAEQTLDARTVALLFSKRSTRTRVASETSAKILGGHPLFLGSADSQLGVNETLEDTARVVGSMADGIMARVNRHEEVAVSLHPLCLQRTDSNPGVIDTGQVLACTSYQRPVRPVPPDANPCRPPDAG